MKTLIRMSRGEYRRFRNQLQLLYILRGSYPGLTFLDKHVKSNHVKAKS